MSSKKDDVKFVRDMLGHGFRGAEDIKTYYIKARKDAKRSHKKKYTNEIKKTNELIGAIRKARNLARDLKLRA